MVVAFETLFLGLVFGAVPVRIAAGPGVAVVELRLDGALVATMRGAPWVHGIQLGPAPRPHELEAVARDAAGKELARASQRVNLPRAEAEAQLVLERGEEGRPSAARLTWDETAAREPTRVDLRLDGVSIAVEDPRRIVLPALDWQIPHVLSAELAFPGGARARVDAVLGGDVAEQVRSDLTAIPVEVGDEAAVAAIAAGGAGLRLDDRPVRAVGVDRGPAEVVFVIDQGAAGRLRARWDAHRTKSALPGPWVPGSNDDRFYLLLPAPRETLGRATELRKLFPLLGPVTLGLDTLCDAALDLRFAGADPATQSLGNAVALAGIHACASNRRRAVVLVLASTGEGTGTVDVAAAQGFLADIHVPLVLWSIEEDAGRRRTRWGDAEDVSSLPKLRRALAGLRRRLDAQRILWIEGSPLPQRIGLDAAVKGVRVLR